MNTMNNNMNINGMTAKAKYHQQMNNNGMMSANQYSNYQMQVNNMSSYQSIPQVGANMNNNNMNQNNMRYQRYSNNASSVNRNDTMIINNSTTVPNSGTTMNNVNNPTINNMNNRQPYVSIHNDTFNINVLNNSNTSNVSMVYSFPNSLFSLEQQAVFLFLYYPFS